MKYYKVIDNDNLGTLSSTHTIPATKTDIARLLTSYYNNNKNCIASSRLALLPAWSEPKLSDLLIVFNLTLEEVKEERG